MIKHYVEFYSPGSFFPETSVREIKSRKFPLTIPKSCYGYHFFDMEQIEKNGEILNGKRKNNSGMTYFGKEYSIEELERDFPKEKILIRNIKGNGYLAAVKTRRGNWQGLTKRDKVINENQT